ncbi:VapC toxin family PIN domain ribonuclease [Methylocystis sp. FS]|uniref:type II toxin-antitoxin system VapC family toxin n=1 Tax=Methylocystis silviterrae TaxID=2743612 RepID=UPI001581BB3F|nr:VapC toxin family PIN domain ribonuclease [Methylocystis silviterrae]NUJ80355.1 VapC toxin family PIN domain ribonuclease [Methylocystis silviterrae]
MIESYPEPEKMFVRRHTRSTAGRSGEGLPHPEERAQHASRRTSLLSLLRNLPRVPLASADEVLELIDRRALHGAGIGYVDAHLIAATLLAAPASLWTGDKRLQSAAARIGNSVL